MDSSQNIAPALNPGDKLGYFEVQAPLAAGGMSLVWKGRDPMLNRDVAIKQLASAGSIDEIVRDKFRKEVEIQKKVSAEHKNLVQVIDYIEDSRGLFLVMEYVDGSSLDRALAKLNGPMDPTEALGIMHQITVGLAAIHEAGVLHRDLKPANILLPREGGVKICDFGLATLMTEQDALTHGTARYMAPELYGGENVDGRADLYSLGFVTYEMLVGRPAFEDAFKTVLRDQRNQALRWMKWHTNSRLTAPAITKLNPDVPQEFADIVARLMDKDPTQRPADAPQLLDILKRTFSGEKPAEQPQAAAPAETGSFAPTAEATAPLPQRSKVPMILAIVLGVQLLGIGAYLLIDSMSKDAEVTEARQAALLQLDQGRRLYADEQYREAGLMLKDLAEQWADDPEIAPKAEAGMYLAAARIKMNEGEALTNQDDFADAELAYESAIDKLQQAEDTHAIDRDMVAKLREEVRLRMSFVDVAGEIVDLIDAKDFSEARHKIRLFRESKPAPNEIEIMDRLGKKIESQSELAQIATILKRAEDLEAEGKFDEARAVIEQANKQFASNQKLQDRYRELSSAITYRNAVSLARRAEQENNYDDAIRHYRNANRIQPSDEFKQKITELTQKRHYRNGVRAQRQGNLNLAKDEFTRALPYAPAKRALEDLGQIVDKNSYVQAGDNAMANREYDKAIDLYKKALSISHDGETAAKLARARLRLKVNELASAMSRNDLKAADRLMEQAIALDPSDAELRRLQAELQLRQQYARLIAEGDEYRQQSLFGNALTSYRKALNLITGTSIDTTEVKQRLSDTEYDSWLAKGRAAMEARQWRQARAALKSAQRERDTQVVRDLLTEVDRNDPDDN